jgi:hypothetical protein
MYWEDAPLHSEGEQRMDRKRENSLPVSDIIDVSIGKQSALLQETELAYVPADCCLSIVSRELRLDLASKYPRDRMDWLAAFRRLRTVRLVYTPYGQGLAPRWTRDDGITVVQLGWGVAYCNPQSIRPR